MIWLLSVALIFTWAIVAVLGWALWQTMGQAGRILARLDALEQRPYPLAGQIEPARERNGVGDTHAVVQTAEPAYTGLAVGTPAPAFDLPDLDGKRHTLDEWLGRRVLIVFFSPRCGFCTEIAADLAAVGPGGEKGGPMPLIVTNGTVAENREWIEESGVRCPVLRQEGMEVANRYQATGTPMGYLIDEQGRIASEMAVGGPPIVALLGPSGKGAPLHSKIPRDGLRAGTPAPEFTLPRIGGGTVSLADYRGRPVVLVFSDPQCGPCDELAPRLESFHRRTPHLDIVMITRGDEKANAAKVAEHRFTFPVALQRRWEVSKKYAMFATPIGYLVDDRGVIAEEVAVGVEAILALLERAVPVSERKEVVGQPS